LAELQPTLSKTKQLLSILNAFYSFTRVEFSLQNKGFSFRSFDGNHQLLPGQLSSGEQQILSLFCIALISNSKPSTFLIDEPELSLNIKWQRKLLGALLELAGRDAQFVIASHAFELITDHRAQVLELKP